MFKDDGRKEKALDSKKALVPLALEVGLRETESARWLAGRDEPPPCLSEKGIQ